MATIKDIAREVGVSHTTVSHALNGTRYVSKETIKRIRSTAEKLNYRPNRAARSLVTKSTKMVGVLISNISNPFFARIIRGIEDEASNAGYQIIIGNSDEDTGKAKHFLESITEHQVDGVIISPTYDFDILLPMINTMGIPIVLVNRRTDKFPGDVVECDNELGGYMATKHLLDLGHKRIGFMTGRARTSTAVDRHAGYRRALAEKNIVFDESLVGYTDSQGEYDASMAFDLLDSRPTAIFAGGGLIGEYVFRALVERSIDIPKDISFVCYDETGWSTLVKPKLTTIEQPTYDMGRKAAALLLGRLARHRSDDESEADRPEPQSIKLKPTIHIRESTAPYAL